MRPIQFRSDSGWKRVRLAPFSLRSVPLRIGSCRGGRRLEAVPFGAGTVPNGFVVGPMHFGCDSDWKRIRSAPCPLGSVPLHIGSCRDRSRLGAVSPGAGKVQAASVLESCCSQAIRVGVESARRPSRWDRFRFASAPVGVASGWEAFRLKLAPFRSVSCWERRRSERFVFEASLIRAVSCWDRWCQEPAQV